MLCGSSFKYKGVLTLLDAVVEYLPASTEVADIRGGVTRDVEKEEFV